MKLAFQLNDNAGQDALADLSPGGFDPNGTTAELVLPYLLSGDLQAWEVSRGKNNPTNRLGQ
jgi:hypothetical protein